jgi:molecular chaperone GrpE
MPNSPESETAQAEEAPPPAVDLAQIEGQLAELDDRYKRALADLDNYRKRAARETERRVADARDAVLRDWLDAVDSVERALRMEPEPSHPLAAGLRAVLEQMEAILARHGIERIGAPGERFDPERHDAVGARETGEAPEGTVLDVARSGFAAGDRVLRPAEVIVARGA